jgi:uncharacterized protein YjiS (DUF1127 family)
MSDISALNSGAQSVWTVSVPNLLATVARWVAAANARRGRRITLAALLAYDEARLDDLGLSRGDIADAINAQRNRSA